MLHAAGYRVFSHKEVMSRIRGGNNTTLIRILPAEAAAECFAAGIDAVFALAPDALRRLGDRLGADTLVVGEEEHIADAATGRRVAVPLGELAAEAGGKRQVGTVVAGCICGMLGLDLELLQERLQTTFATKGDEVVQANLAAARLGHARGADHPLTAVPEPGMDPAIRTMCTGAEAVGIGALAGGCDFVGSYPMSPSTGVLVHLAGHAEAFGLAVEQAEDEIAALNMVLGAWYAGGRGLATTSGGGFALMGEALSLAGCLELPAVIHLAQRPGPATGLPTRTEQGDLELALYSGHGEFPRILLAPGSHDEAVELTRVAFELADKHQSPVIILTDQYLMDASAGVERRGFPAPQRYVVETGEDYQRYAPAGNGHSPRGVPGHGPGRVRCDSDEHDADGRITESFDVRVTMVDKRLAKLDGILADAVPPDRAGPDEAHNLVIGWGSTRGPIRAALTALGFPDCAHLHLRQVHPLPEAVVEAIRAAGSLTVVENNATGQFARYLAGFHGIRADHAVRQYDGMPFAEEDLIARFQEVLDV